MLKNKQFASKIQSLEVRKQAVREFLKIIRPSLRVSIVVIDDAFGPSIQLPDLQAITGSAETLSGCLAVNKIRVEKSKELVASGDMALDPYEFDFLLLCNKICGASHYNMQMKIIVETEQEFEEWMNSQQTFAEVIQ